MEDKFRASLVNLLSGYKYDSTDTRAGKGIRPENQEAKVKAEAAEHILKLYDKHHT